MDQARPLGSLIGPWLRDWREARGVRQDDVASAVRPYGLDWSRGTVANIEAGDREVSLEETSILIAALKIDLQTLIDRVGRQSVTTTQTVLVTASGLADRLREPVPRPSTPRTVNLTFEAVDPCLWVWPDVPSQTLTAAAIAAEHDAEKKAAKKLSRRPLELSLAAYRTWGRCLTEERDRRIEGGAPERSLQARRGHITRRLIEELRPLLSRGAEK